MQVMVQGGCNTTDHSTKFGTPVLVHLFYVDIIDIVVVHVNIHVGALVVWYDRESIVRTVEGDPDGLSIPNTIGEDHYRQGIEQVTLDRTVERTGPVNRRVTGCTKEVLRILVDLKGHLSLYQPVLDLFQPDVHDLFHVPQRESALEGGDESTP